MDETFQVNLLRNVQPTDRKLSVSREFVGPKKREERNRKDAQSAAGPEKPRKAVRLYGRDVSENPADEEHEGRIDITI